jgi:lipoate-protein ligase A
METGRLIVDPPSSGSWNMAVDHALLESANESGLITLRVYAWSAATVSLGYFQRYQDREVHAASADCSLVRRSTGGGAIVHDREMTYSLSVPSSNRWSKSNEQIYFLVHEIIVQLLAEQGVKAELFDGPKATDGAESFLCFQRRTKGDVVLKGYKVCGSAQRRKKNALIQHGSLLLQMSPHAPELPGILDLSSESGFSTADVVSEFSSRVADRLGVNLSVGEMDSSETRIAELANKEIYAIGAWNQKR